MSLCSFYVFIITSILFKNVKIAFLCVFKEVEKRREEKRIQAEQLKEWSRPRDDMECDDLKVILIGQGENIVIIGISLKCQLLFKICLLKLILVERNSFELIKT